MSPTDNQNNNKILIIGGGIGGLVVAQGLKKLNIPFILFERDESSSFRQQGYRLRINPEGSQALKQVLSDDIWELFTSSCAVFNSGQTQIDAITGDISSRSSANRIHFPERDNMVFSADRTLLRCVLESGLKQHLEYGKKFERYEMIKSADGQDLIEAHFSDGSKYIGTLLIGADGLNSKVRKQFIPELKYLDTCGRAIYGKTPITNSLLTKLPASVMEWTTIISDSRPLTLFMEPIKFRPPTPGKETQLPIVQDYIYWVLLSQAQVFGKSDKELYAMSESELKQHQLEMIKDWNEPIKNIIIHSDESKSSYLSITSSKPDVYQWETNKNITLLGDSCHAMTPTGGAGANTAIIDAFHLVEAIKNGAAVNDLNQYECKMRQYAKVSIEGSLGGAKRMFGFKSIDDCKFID
ncbi:hypothetical protein CYY_009652 [Polysphondylium violaceum]|uniref:FAD-binding domain-containing protein n=1 Tax=Polysphondylium violaceum TaxID=133409 RepID=A0A8J4UPC4_9MYCE|nr:hypothetical protein CYY_009652 [Polysphondylium violaceum]